MKSIKTILIWFLLGSVLTACSNDFLDLKQPVEPILETYYTDTVTAFNGLVGCYNSLQQVPSPEAKSLLFFQLDSRSDDTDYAGNPLGASQENNYYAAAGFANFDIFSDNQYSLLLWRYGYNGINTINKYMEGVSGMTLTVSQQKLIDQYKAEAKFIRAYFYFQLVKTFGGVPVFSKSLLQNEWLVQKRATEEEVFNQIFTDLREAIPLLPLKSGYPDAQLNRITKGAAQALLAKALITNAEVNAASPNWAEAYILCDEIEKSAQYDLNTNVKDIFSAAGQTASEHVFDIVFDETIKGEEDSYIHYLSPRYIFKNSVPDHSDKMTYGFGLCAITEDLANQYLADITTAGGTDTYVYYNQTNNDTLRYTKMLDQRGRYTFWSRFEKYLDVYSVDILTTRSETRNPQTTDDANYYQRKYNRTSKGLDYAITGVNLHIIRYADVLLLKAEAAYYTGKNTEALQLVNMVRERAFRQAIANNRITKAQFERNSTGVALLADIWQERRLELAGEFDRFNDLKRTHRLELLEITKPDILFRTGKHELMPIPAAEISRASNIIQNPNY